MVKEASAEPQSGLSRFVPGDSVQLDRHCARAWWRAALLLSGGLVRPDGNLAFIESATLATARERSDEFDAVQNRSGANSLNLAPYPEVA